MEMVEHPAYLAGREEDQACLEEMAGMAWRPWGEEERESQVVRKKGVDEEKMEVVQGKHVMQHLQEEEKEDNKMVPDNVVWVAWTSQIDTEPAGNADVLPV